MAMEDRFKEVAWLGDARKNMIDFPTEVRKSMGYALQLAQAGGMSTDAKPFKGVGSGVFEIVKRHNTDTYRAVYAVKIGEKIYVLHAFQKKSKSGIKTPQADIELIKQRYKEALRREGL